MSSTLMAVSQSLFKKAIPLYHSSAFTAPLTAKTVRINIPNFISLSAQMKGYNYLSDLEPIEIPPEKPDKEPPISPPSPSPDFPGPPNPLPPEHDPPGPDMPGPPPEIVPPGGPDVVPPVGPEIVPPGWPDVTPPAPPEIIPPGGPDVVPPKPEVPGRGKFPGPTSHHPSSFNLA